MENKCLDFIGMTEPLYFNGDGYESNNNINRIYNNDSCKCAGAQWGRDIR